MMGQYKPRPCHNLTTILVSKCHNYNMSLKLIQMIRTSLFFVVNFNELQWLEHIYGWRHMTSREHVTSYGVNLRYFQSIATHLKFTTKHISPATGLFVQKFIQDNKKHQQSTALLAIRAGNLPATLVSLPMATRVTTMPHCTACCTFVWGR